MPTYIIVALCILAVLAVFTFDVLLRRRFGNPETMGRTPVQNVRSLVPAYSAADPKAPSAGTVRLAFRAHVIAQNQLSLVVVSFRDLLAMEHIDDEQRALQLCELYSRAIFESAFAAHFDGTDPCTDKVVLNQIADALGTKTARMVHERVASYGLVLRELTPAVRGPRQRGPGDAA